MEDVQERVTPASQGRRKGSLFRKYVLVFVILISGTLLASSLAQSYVGYQEFRRALGALQSREAAAAADSIERFLEQIEGQTTWAVLTARASEARAGAERRDAFLTLLRLAPAVTSVTYVDSRGREQLRVSRVAVDVVGSQEDRSQESWFLGTRTYPVYRTPVSFRDEYEPYMTLALVDPGPDGGITAADLNLTLAWDVVSSIKVGKSGYAYLVDSDGQLIAHPDLSEVLQNPKPNLRSLPHVRAALSGGTNPADQGQWPMDADVGGRSVLTSYATVRLSGAGDLQTWSILVEQPREEAMEPLYSSLLQTAIVLAMGLALSVMVSLALARRIVNPIQVLKEGVDRISQGQWEHRVTLKTGDELEDLAQQFNAMADKLQDQYQNLEAKVRKRTRELADAVKDLQALVELSRKVSSTLDLQQVLGLIVADAASLSRADAGAIFEFDEPAGEFRLRASHMLDAKLTDKLRARPPRLGEGTVGQAGLTRAPVQITDIREAYPGPLRGALIEAGVCSLVAVPLLLEGRVVGGLVLARAAPGEFRPQDVELLQSFAGHSALAIHNARLFGEIQKMIHELETTSQRKSQLLAIMSHELRAPLQVIMGNVKLILDGAIDPEKIRDRLRRAQAKSEDLLSLIDEVLDFSKIEARLLPLSVSDYSLGDVVSRSCDSMEPLALQKNLALRLKVPSDLPSGRGDPGQITRVLTNLLSNAIKFTDMGSVDVEVLVSGDKFVVSVSDTGIGIAEADQPRVFEAFWQSNGHEKAGIGLGLSISKGIVQAHGGSIGLNSTPGEGSTFWFTLPVRVQTSGEGASGDLARGTA